MVSELVLLRPTSVPTNEGFYVTVGKARKKESLISDLKAFINRRFNFPQPQVSVDDDGGVVITGLYDGVPEGADYSHEVFDHILDLVGWIEGCVELPIGSEIFALKVPDQMSMDEPLVIEIGSSLKPDGEHVQTEAKIEPFLMKESSYLDAHQVLDKLPEPQEHMKQVVLKIVETGASFDPGGKQSIVVNEFLQPVAHQLFDEMSKSDSNHNSVEQEEFSPLESTIGKKLPYLVAYKVLDKLLEPKTDLKALEKVSYDPGRTWINHVADENAHKAAFTSSGVGAFEKSKLHPNTIMPNEDKRGFEAHEHAWNFACGISRTDWLARDDCVETLSFDLGGRPFSKLIETSIYELSFGQVPLLKFNAPIEASCSLLNFLNVAKQLTDGNCSFRSLNFDPGGGFTIISFEAGEINGEAHLVEILNEGAHRRSHIDYVGKFAFDPGGELFRKFMDPFLLDFHADILFLLKFDKTDYKGLEGILCFDSAGVKALYVQFVTDLLNGMCVDLCCLKAQTGDNDCIHDKYQLKVFNGAMKSLQQNNLICIGTRSERGLLIMLEMKDINSEMASMVIYDFLQIFNQGAIKCELLEFLPMKRRVISGHLREEILAFDQHAIKRAHIPSRIEVLNSSLRINFVPGDIFIEIIDAFFKAYEQGDNTYSAEASLSWPSDSIEVLMVIFRLNFAISIRSSCHVLHLLNKIKMLTEDDDSMDIFIFDPGGELMLDYLVPCLPNESELVDSSLSKAKNMYELLRNILDTGMQVVLVSAGSYYLVALILCMSKVAIMSDVLKLLLIYPTFCPAVKPAVFWDETQIQLEGSLPYFMLFDLEIYQIRLLTAAEHFESMNTSIVVFIFDPGGGSYFCFAILIVQCPSQQCYQRQLHALPGASPCYQNIILEDKDVSKGEYCYRALLYIPGSI